MTIQEYIDKLNDRYKQGNSTEHSFRVDLQNLLESLVKDAQVTNEPKRIECGAPDYIITKKEIPIGYIEAKDIDADLSSKNYKEQFKRYKDALPNLIITNYLDFEVYKEGEKVSTYTIGAIEGGKVTANPKAFDAFKVAIQDFSTYVGQTIKSPQKLAVMMAGKAKMLATVINSALDSDEETKANSTLQEQLQAFKDILIHDIKPNEFADIYAQTIAYGMFAARLHDYELDTFSRIEAAQKIPKSNPFLRKLFGYIAGIDLDDRLVWIVDALADIFRATDVRALLKNFGKATRQTDPIIHFYETFLSEYDPKLRKSRGVWYTPEPVVNFIVRAVDDILKTEFGLSEGLADTSKVKVKRKVISKATTDQRSKIKETEIEEEVHRVQILDPATGTGTFLAEVIKQIHEGFKGQEGIWSSYVDEHLIPRLNGFELLMASYAMAHLKLDMLLTETGYKPKGDQRLRVYLTNSLEEHHPDTGTLFANWLSTEANEANHIKRDSPVMVVLGNPPYLGESKNKGKWIMKLMEDYKKEPGEKKRLKEKNSKFINDDYVKFLRYGEYFIEKNGEGVLAFINPHGFLDNPTFRGMRWHLLKTYDKIYTIDLHGNNKKEEVSPNGEKDENVFDIIQGVSINLFIKKKKEKDELAEVHHHDLYGRRKHKYDFLNSNSIHSIRFNNIELHKPQYYFAQKDFSLLGDYEEGFGINQLIPVNSLGVLTKKDKFIIDFDKHKLFARLNDFIDNSNTSEKLSEKYSLKIADNDKWNLADARNSLLEGGISESKFKKIQYRCFDTRTVYYDSNFVARLNTRVLSNITSQNDIALISTRQLAVNEFTHIFLSNYLSDQCYISNRTKEGCYVFPLYTYPEGEIFDTGQRQPNLDEKIVAEIAECLGLTFTNEKEDTKDTFAPIDILDYIYAVLHSPTYRETYKEFLKIDFPRVPYPKDADKFWQLVKLGGELRQIHLLESPVVNQFITKYPIAGSNEVEKMGKDSYKDGKVFINEEQYFEDVPETAWEFYIGGYQPAQKWLKDRKGRELSIEDIKHYQKIIVALTETNRIMQEIDEIEIVEGD